MSTQSFPAVDQESVGATHRRSALNVDIDNLVVAAESAHTRYQAICTSSIDGGCLSAAGHLGQAAEWSYGVIWRRAIGSQILLSSLGSPLIAV